MLDRSLFLLQNRFLALLLPNLTDLDKILHTPIVVRNTLGRLKPPLLSRSALEALRDALYKYSTTTTTTTTIIISITKKT